MGKEYLFIQFCVLSVCALPVQGQLAGFAGASMAIWASAERLNQIIENLGEEFRKVISSLLENEVTNLVNHIDFLIKQEIKLLFDEMNALVDHIHKQLVDLIIKAEEALVRTIDLTIDRVRQIITETIYPSLAALLDKITQEIIPALFRGLSCSQTRLEYMMSGLVESLNQLFHNDNINKYCINCLGYEGLAISALSDSQRYHLLHCRQMQLINENCSLQVVVDAYAVCQDYCKYMLCKDSSSPWYWAQQYFENLERGRAWNWIFLGPPSPNLPNYYNITNLKAPASCAQPKNGGDTIHFYNMIPIVKTIVIGVGITLLIGCVVLTTIKTCCSIRRDEQLIRLVREVRGYGTL